MATISGDRSADHTSQHRGDGVPSDGYNRHLTISGRPGCSHRGIEETPQSALRIGLLDNGPQRAISSAGERSLHTGEVTGSIPVLPTKIPLNILRLAAFQIRYFLIILGNSGNGDTRVNTKGELCGPVGNPITSVGLWPGSIRDRDLGRV